MLPEVTARLCLARPISPPASRTGELATGPPGRHGCAVPASTKRCNGDAHSRHDLTDVPAASVGALPLTDRGTARTPAALWRPPSVSSRGERKKNEVGLQHKADAKPGNSASRLLKFSEGADRERGVLGCKARGCWNTLRISSSRNAAAGLGSLARRPERDFQHPARAPSVLQSTAHHPSRTLPARRVRPAGQRVRQGSRRASPLGSPE